MKISNKFLTLALVAVAMIFASCSKDDDSAQKDAENFSRDIIGMWEGVEVTGDETNGNAEARIAYFDDGTYIHYSKLADVWFPRSDEASEYSIEGNKLTSRWKPAKAENYSSEWWNIDAIKDGVMKWTASRERKDGSKYTATFTWKKVDDTLNSEQILAKLFGTWAYGEMKSFYFLKGEIVDSKTIPADPQTTFTFNDDGNSWFSYPNVKDPANKIRTEYTYTVRGNVLTLVTEKKVINGEEIVRDVYAFKLVNAISDDQLVLVEYIDLDEDSADLFGNDAILAIISMDRVE